MSDSPELSLVIPAYNEGAHIRASLARIAEEVGALGLSYELIVVDDGSRDNTWAQLQSAASDIGGLRALRLSRNFGKERALCAGLEAARGRAAIVMDADLQHPPELIRRMVTIWQSGEADIVEAVKSHRGRESGFNRFSARLYYRLMRLLTGYDLGNASDFKLLDRRVLEAWSRMGERNVFFRGMSAWVGFRTRRIRFRVADRIQGKSKWSLIQLVRLAASAIVSFSSLPLRITTLLGVVFFITAVPLALQTVRLWLIGEAAVGFTTVILMQLIIGGFILTSLGVIGEYIAMIYDEVKGRPRYLVAESIEEKK